MPNVMAAKPNTGGALCKSSVIPMFLVPWRKAWLTLECHAVTLPMQAVRGQEPPKYIV